jgi:hypothetical protein
VDRSDSNPPPNPEGILYCIFCGRAITLPGGRYAENLQWHHVDGDQEKEPLPSHAKCHHNYHAIIRNWAWQLGMPSSNPLAVEAAWSRQRALQKMRERA